MKDEHAFEIEQVAGNALPEFRSVQRQNDRLHNLCAMIDRHQRKCPVCWIGLSCQDLKTLEFAAETAVTSFIGTLRRYDGIVDTLSKAGMCGRWME